MISIDKCKKELQCTSKQYTDDEIKIIREFLYKVATVEYEHFKEQLEYECSDVS